MKEEDRKKHSKKQPKKQDEDSAGEEEESNKASPSPWSPMPSDTDLPQFAAPIAVPGHKGIDELIYYHGLLPRLDVNGMLKNDGEFLIRNTELVLGSAVRQMCLSVKSKGQVLHFPLQPNASDNMFSIDGKESFKTIVALINNYYESRKPFANTKVKLLKPVPRHDWELLHNQVALGRKLGEGAFGAVFAGVLRIKPGEAPIDVAVKTMKCASQSKTKIEELMKEARLMREMDHPNIVRCLGIAAEVEPLYIVVELVDGGALDHHLKKHTVNVVIEERLKMIWDAACAVEYVHSLGILHCDIAARNCLYAEYRLKLSDFGMSRKTELHKLAPDDVTPVRWTAPEVFIQRTITQAADIWAMGVLVWEIFNNAREPFEGLTGQAVRDQVVQNHFRLPKLPGWAPPEMNALLDEMFIWDPKERIEIAGVSDRMRNICEKYPFKPPPPSSSSPLQQKKKVAPPSSSSSDTGQSKSSSKKSVGPGRNRGGTGTAGSNTKKSTKSRKPRRTSTAVPKDETNKRNGRSSKKPPPKRD